MKPILEIQNISKRFSINHEQQPYLSVRESLVNIFKRKTSKEDFWALKDVSFNVEVGDTIGIVGKNGAGKSTLLKVLSKITPPSSGKITSRGRIASLLEVGTGFHPELSGRENIFMNGSILGMRRAEILRNFDAIVDFAGVSKFIDTPLKHYSSGMQLRLAFAVAAFLENEILIIDEVLAVGDADFQKKCMGKMGDISQSGRTILFVSHNMTALESLCNKAILLQNGTVRNSGKTKQIIHEHLDSSTIGERIYDSKLPQKRYKANEYIDIMYACVENASSTNKDDVLDITNEIDIKLVLVNKSKEDMITVGFDLLTIKGDVVFGSGEKFYCKIGQETKLVCRIPGNFLNDDTYQLYSYFLSDSMATLFQDKEMLTFEIKDIQRDMGYLGKVNGFVRPKLKWTLNNF
jgi:lipopolysaccharide transport system ATP-binding protein